jgi:transcriptional regulator with XRE-family HTH domain
MTVSRHRCQRIGARATLRVVKSEDDSMAERLARNVRALREARGITQVQAAKAADVPRATWGHLESGTANPTLNVLRRVSQALQVTIEELVAPPRESAKKFTADELPVRGSALAKVRSIVPEPLSGVQFERIELAARARFTGVPHRGGTREFLACESGAIAVFLGGEKWVLTAGEVLCFRGDQRHSYVNEGAERAVGFSVVVIG